MLQLSVVQWHRPPPRICARIICCWFSSHFHHQREEAMASAKYSIQMWANKSRSWERLEPVVELALSPDPLISRRDETITSSASSSSSLSLAGQTLADIGTDHGMLAQSLAMTGLFEKVTGVDLSARALERGGLKLEKMILKRRQTQVTKSQSLSGDDKQQWPPLAEFRCGSGLTVLQPGEADIVCIAGMGARTMAEILLAKSSTGNAINASQGEKGVLLLDQLGCQRLVLQPANAKPHRLCRLYKTLFDIGWVPLEERILNLSGGFFISSSFHRRHDYSDVGATKNQNKTRCENGVESMAMPLSLVLAAATSNVTKSDERLGQQQEALRGFVNFHRDWIHSVLRHPGATATEFESKWLNYFDHVR
ncbi:hypothetical protein ACA910_014474 [Epithemia clementina (nom. ined.)]